MPKLVGVPFQGINYLSTILWRGVNLLMEPFPQCTTFVTSADLYAKVQCGEFNLMASKFK